MAAVQRILWSLALLLLASADPRKGDGRPAPIFLTAPPERPSNLSRCFIVKMREDVPLSEVQEMMVQRNETEGGLWESAFHGFYHCASTVNKTRLAAWANDSRVEYVEEDRRVKASAVQAVSPVLWNLDRIDQHFLPLDGAFVYNYTGRGVYVYVVDTGVRSTHEQLAGRVQPGQSFVPGIASNDTADCNGHGTHVTGTLAGSLTGVAKEAMIVPVRVLDCNGEGTTINVINALNWIANSQPKPGVINLSLCSDGSTAVDTAVQNVISKGFQVVVAAGDSADDACQYSPARVSGAITVGWTTRQDMVAPYSSYGSCVDLFAPGSSIYSAWYTSDGSYMQESGSSMSTALVSGVVAAYLQANASASPASMQAFLQKVATSGVLQGLDASSPNLLLYSRGMMVSNSPASSASNTALYWILVVPGVLLPLCIASMVVLVICYRRAARKEKRLVRAAGLRRPQESWGVARGDPPAMVYGIPIQISVEQAEEGVVVAEDEPPGIALHTESEPPNEGLPQARSPSNQVSPPDMNNIHDEGAPHHNESPQPTSAA